MQLALRQKLFLSEIISLRNSAQEATISLRIIELTCLCWKGNAVGCWYVLYIATFQF